MNKIVELIITMIVTIGTYFISQISLLSELFRSFGQYSEYVPVGLAIFTGLIFFIFLSAPVTKSMLKRLSQIEERLMKMNMKELAFSLMGCVIGLIIANLIGMAFSGFGAIGTFIIVLLNILFGFLGIRVASRKKDEVNVKGMMANLIPPMQTSKQGDLKKESSAGRPKILDTSVIIDGRIMDILQTGFVEGTIIIPDFVLQELRHIADSADDLKRNRGRRGLDILNEIQKQLSIPVKIMEFPVKQPMEVDAKLLKMAESMDAFVVTNDFNLNKVAEFQGVRVLNINELANAIKPVVLPGEEMQVTIIKEGKEAGQGVAYLGDGTMIVVEGGGRHLGETRQVIVTSVLQTAAGRMIFTKMMAAA